jgi:GTP cyclohydrolase II
MHPCEECNESACLDYANSFLRLNRRRAPGLEQQHRFRATDQHWVCIGAGSGIRMGSPHNSAITRAIESCSYNLSVTRSNVTKLAEANFPTRWGQFRIYGFEGYFDVPAINAEAGETFDGMSSKDALGREGKLERRKETAVALVMGDIKTGTPLVRIHSQCLTGDVFGSLRCDCRQQLEMALEAIASTGCGVLVYEQQEGRGIGLMAKLQAYELQDAGLDTVQANEKLGFRADCREYNLPVEVMKALGLKQVRLMSNNPEKVQAVEKAGIKVVERVSAEVEAYEFSEAYLRTKREKMGHLFSGK